MYWELLTLNYLSLISCCCTVYIVWKVFCCICFIFFTCFYRFAFSFHYPKCVWIFTKLSENLDFLQNYWKFVWIFYKLFEIGLDFYKLSEICLDFYKNIRNMFGFLTKLSEICLNFLQIIRNMFGFLQNYPIFVWIFYKLSEICLDFYKNSGAVTDSKNLQSSYNIFE